jgi:hypothetical protein
LETLYGGRANGALTSSIRINIKRYGIADTRISQFASVAYGAAL